MKNFDFKKRLIMWLIIISLVILAKIIYDKYSVEEKHNTVELTIQYFEDCIYVKELTENTKKAIDELNLNIELNQLLVNNDELAKKYQFRGSPTLLINGIDLMNMPEPVNGSLSCRVYKDGVPSAETIKKRILEEIKKNNKG